MFDSGYSNANTKTHINNYLNTVNKDVECYQKSTNLSLHFKYWGGATGQPWYLEPNTQFKVLNHNKWSILVVMNTSLIASMALWMPRLQSGLQNIVVTQYLNVQYAAV